MPSIPLTDSSDKVIAIRTCFSLLSDICATTDYFVVEQGFQIRIPIHLLFHPSPAYRNVLNTACICYFMLSENIRENSRELTINFHFTLSIEILEDGFFSPY
ncbi:MAG: hypothetical protein OEY51_11860 [Cyclobacteriaceae bacterium]|nr:hypothetical protein [Cyclobacteriaceae bacterium]